MLAGVSLSIRVLYSVAFSFIYLVMMNMASIVDLPFLNPCCSLLLVFPVYPLEGL